MPTWLKPVVVVIAVPLGAVGSIAVLCIAPVVLPLVWLLNHREKKRYAKRVVAYQAFLDQHEGYVFFCYTSRKNSATFVEQKLLPLLPSHIHVIRLQGRDPVSEFPATQIAWMLHRVEHVGFPNVMRIHNGRVTDRSLHKVLYETINQDAGVQTFLKQLYLELENMSEDSKTGTG